MTKLVPAVLVVLVSVGIVLAEGDQPAAPQVSLVPLKHIDAGTLASLFGGDQPPTLPKVDVAPARREFADAVRSSALEAAHLSPDMMGEAGLYLFPLQASVEIVPAPLGYRFPAGGPERPRIGLRALLPDGLTEGPVAFADENAVIVRGRADAIDEFREIVALLDKPAKRVSLSLRLFVPTDVDSAGLRDIEAGPGESEAEEGHRGSVASAVVPSNRLAILRTGLAAPFVVAPAKGSPDGHQANAAVDAREFLVLPRVNADSSVSLLILPGDGGEVPWADPTGRAAADESPILLRKDGTAVLGGFPRAGELVAKEGGPVHLAAPGASVDSQALLLISARVVPDGEVQAALPAN